LVARFVIALQIAKKTTTLTNELQQPATRVVVLLVCPEVIRKELDASGKKSNLNLSGTGITLLASKLLNDFRLIGSCERHFSVLWPDAVAV